MKMKIIAVIAALFTSTLYAQSGSELFANNCSSCHSDVLGVNIDIQDEYSYIAEAPYIDDLITKLKAKTKNEKHFTKFIEDYINNPDKRKSLYGKRAIKKFGLMPALKGSMTDKEIQKLSKYLYSGHKVKKVVVPKKVVVVTDPREKLFTKNCASCHANILGVSVDLQGEYSYISDAPYVKVLVPKLKAKTKNKLAFTIFLQSYINNPDKRKSLYGKRAIKKFGLMPSLKDAMTDKESIQLADYLYETY